MNEELKIATEPELECSSLDCNSQGVDYCKECSHGWHLGFVEIGTRIWRWKFNSFFGINFIRKDGELLKNQPGENHDVWPIVDEWLREHFTKKYMKLTFEMMEKLPDEEIEFCEIYKDVREDIFLICEIVENMALRKGGIDKENKFFNDIVSESKTKKDILNMIWTHLVVKFIKAPTAMHTEGVVILCMPLLKRAIEYYEKNEH